jgi:RimJ/RimL family protein N-acetyltransferase
VVSADQPVLAGPTVTLPPLSRGDAGALADAAAESRQHYTSTRVPDGIEEAKSYISAALRERESGHRMPFTTLWHDRVVGCTSYLDLQQWRWPTDSPLQRTDRPDALEIGATWLSASAQRTRCNTEAKHLMLTHAFDLWQVHRLALKTDERNSRSRQAIERLGARLDGVRRADMPGQDGSVRNSAYYSIVRAEWPAIRAKLEEALRKPW